jgi:TRAP-type transport system periplasmic protein
MNKLLSFHRAAIVVALLGASTLSFAQSTVKLTLGHGAAPGNPRHEASLKFAEVVKAKSKLPPLRSLAMMLQW